MGIKNYLIEGVSGTGKTTVCEELLRRGFHAIHGDRELAYQGDPEAGIPTNGRTHEHHIWRVDKVKTLIANKDEAVTFFCGGSRNFSKFIDLFDGVFVLDIDPDTLNKRLDLRQEDDWGAKKSERDLIIRLHKTKEDIPKNGIVIDSTPPLAQVVDAILSHCDIAKTSPNQKLIEQAYTAFNCRNIDSALALMTENVSWPKASEGGRATGKEDIRAYWTRQWNEFDPEVKPVEIVDEDGGTTKVRVHKIVKNLSGEVLFDGEVIHVYTIANGLIERMDIEEIGGKSESPSAAFTR